MKDKDEKNFIIFKKEDRVTIGWIGLNGLQSSDGIAWIKVLAILPEHWGKGYGSDSIKAIKEILREMGFKKVRLWTDEINTRARVCYEVNDFKIINKKLNAVGTLGVIRDRILLECKL